MPGDSGGVVSSTDSTMEDASGSSYTVYRKPRDFITIALVVAMLVTVAGGFAFGYHRVNQVAVLTQGYDLDRAFLGGRAWGSSSMFNGVTINVLKDGRTYRCKHVHFDDLREGKPIACDHGVVFKKK